MVYAKQETRVGQMPNGSIAKERVNRAIDQAALTVFDLIGQFNDPERRHLLMGYFKPDDDLAQLEANLCKVEAHIDKAMRKLREELLLLKMLREAVDYLLSQTHA